MNTRTEHELTRLIGSVAYPLENDRDLDPLLEMIGEARYVLLGEASHGTHEYYTWRTRITKRLIEEKGFSFVAVEGDWPDCYRLNRYIKGYHDSGTGAAEVLHTFDRWPTWMWANWETVALAEWMRTFNGSRSQEQKAGFYGLDVYSLWESMEAIIRYLELNDPDAIPRVKEAMECFEPYNVREGFSYASASYGILNSCAGAVGTILSTIRERMDNHTTDREAAFSAEQNALVAVHAEQYFQVMLSGGAASWNIRDRHMNETLNRLMAFHGPEARAIVWEHNTHIGDARATDMFASGLINVGQLVKEEHGKEGVFRIGFGSYEGSVIAASGWGQPMREMSLPPAKTGSWEHLLHTTGADDKLIFSADISALREAVGHRAVGVVYDPANERGNYVPTLLPLRYEAFIYLDRTQALHPLHVHPDRYGIPETYPWGV
jgi:erythromycin esterase